MAIFGTGKGAGKLILIMIIVVGFVALLPTIKRRFG